VHDRISRPGVITVTEDGLEINAEGAVVLLDSCATLA